MKEMYFEIKVYGKSTTHTPDELRDLIYELLSDKAEPYSVE